MYMYVCNATADGDATFKNSYCSELCDYTFQSKVCPSKTIFSYFLL